jgi:hypothetical protein
MRILDFLQENNVRLQFPQHFSLLMQGKSRVEMR